MATADNNTAVDRAMRLIAIEQPGLAGRTVMEFDLDLKDFLKQRGTKYLRGSAVSAEPAFLQQDDAAGIGSREVQIVRHTDDQQTLAAELGQQSLKLNLMLQIEMRRRFV